MPRIVEEEENQFYRIGVSIDTLGWVISMRIIYDGQDCEYRAAEFSEKFQLFCPFRNLNGLY